MANITYNLTPEFQQIVAYYCCTNLKFWGSIVKHLDVRYFSDAVTQKTIAAVQEIYDATNTVPTQLEVLFQHLNAKVESGTTAYKKADYEKIKEMLMDTELALGGNIAGGVKTTLVELVDQIKDAKMREFTYKVVDASKKSAKEMNIIGMSKELQDINNIGCDTGEIQYTLDKKFLNAYRSFSLSDRIPTGISALDMLMKGGIGKGLTYIVMGTGVGKCHTKGTKLVMANGTLRAVEDIQVGDQLMGAESSIRTVLATPRGRSKCYRVNVEGSESFNVTEGHLLTVSQASGPRVTLRDVLVEDLFNGTVTGKFRIPQLHKTKFCDGKIDTSLILNTIMEGKVVDDSLFLRGWFKSRATALLALVKGSGHQLDILRKKAEYIRVLRVLAMSVGIDPDIVLTHNLRNKLLGREKAPVTYRKFTITELPGEHAYFGVTVDQDARYLVGNFCLTHNSMMMCHMAVEALCTGRNVAYATLELPSEMIGGRCMANLFGLTTDDLNEDSALLLERQNIVLPLIGSLYIKKFAHRTPLRIITNWVDDLNLEGKQIDVVIIDMARKVTSNFYDAKPGKSFDKYLNEAEVAAEFREWAINNGLWGITADQLVKNGRSRDSADPDAMAGSSEKSNEADTILMFYNTNLEDESSPVFNAYVSKDRYNVSGLKVSGVTPDYEHCRLELKTRAFGDYEF